MIKNERELQDPNFKELTETRTHRKRQKKKAYNEIHHSEI